MSIPSDLSFSECCQIIWLCLNSKDGCNKATITFSLCKTQLCKKNHDKIYSREALEINPCTRLVPSDSFHASDDTFLGCNFTFFFVTGILESLALLSITSPIASYCYENVILIKYKPQMRILHSTINKV